MKHVATATAALALSLFGCTNQKIDEYAHLTPKMDIREYLNGDIEAWGMVMDYAGKQNDHFYAKLKGTWKGSSGELAEDFTYSDGRKDKRTWHITFKDDVNFTATAHDVIGEAVGVQKGNAANMQYTLRIPYKGSTLDLRFDDWLYLVDETTVINRAGMYKYGFKVGELIVTFRKVKP